MRIGKFSVSRDLIEYHPSEVIEMFYQLRIIPVRAESMFSGEVEYIGICDKFVDIPNSIIPPNYMITARKENDPHEGNTVITYSIEEIK